METTNQLSRSSGGFIKNALLITLGLGTVSFGYLFLRSADQNKHLQEELNRQRFNGENNEKAFSFIEASLADVSARAGVISSNLHPEGISSDAEQRVIKEIVFIDKLMAKNRDIIANL